MFSFDRPFEAVVQGIRKIYRYSFITNNTPKIQLKIHGGRFGPHLVPLPTLNAHVMLGLKPWCKKKKEAETEPPKVLVSLV